MAKEDILTQIYPDEIEYITAEIRQKNQQKAIDRVNILMATVLPYSDTKKEDSPAKNWFDIMLESLNEYREEEQEELTDEEKYEKGLEELFGMLGDRAGGGGKDGNKDSGESAVSN